MNLLPAAICAVVLLCAGCAATTPQFVSSPPPDPSEVVAATFEVGDTIEVDYYPTGRVLDQSYRIAAEDRLRFDVADHPALSREMVLVLPDGTVSLPEIGPMMAAGKTIDELAQDLRERLRRALIRDPRVTVAVQEGDARLRSLINRRGSNGSTDANLFQISDDGRLQLPFIAPVSAVRSIDLVRADIGRAYRQVFGDRIEVSLKQRLARPRQVFVFGEVLRPGAVDYTPAVTSLSAVAAAGGFLQTAESSTVVLFRSQADGSHRAWLLDLRSVLTQASAPTRIAVRVNDVIYVPKTGVALANDAIEQYVRRMIPLPANIGIGINVTR